MLFVGWYECVVCGWCVVECVCECFFDCLVIDFVVCVEWLVWYVL